MSKPLATDFANYAKKPQWLGIPYERWDCQKYVEEMLRGVGAYKNYKGSNDMWRNALNYKDSIDGMTKRHNGQLKPGTWLFTIKRDGGERERGYKDDEGNAAHVGIYVGGSGSYNVVHSTTGGVQTDKLTSRRWTHAGECILLDYGNDIVTPSNNLDDIIKALEQIIKALKEGI